MISMSSHKMNNHGHFLDSKKGETSVIGTPQIVTFASLRGRSFVIGKCNSEVFSPKSSLILLLIVFGEIFILSSYSKKGLS